MPTLLPGLPHTGQIQLCPVWLRAVRLSFMEEARIWVNPSALGTGWHSELTAVPMPITKGMASAMEGSPKSLVSQPIRSVL